MVMRLWLNHPTGGHGHVICMANLGEVFSHENTPEGCTETNKNSFFPYKQVSGEMVIINDLEWQMLSYYVNYYERFRNVMQQIEKEALIQDYNNIPI